MAELVQLTYQRETRPVRQIVIEQDQIDMLAFENGQGLRGRVGAGDDAEPGTLAT